MKHDTEHIDLLISRYLAGEATTEEVRELEAWMEASDANQKYFDHFRFVHDKAITSFPYKTYNTDKAWENLRQKMHSSKSAKVKPLHSTKYRLGIAAGILMLIGVTSLFFFLRDTPVEKLQIVKIMATDSTKNQVLADNSTVVLNKNSSITYSKDFGKKNREVKLAGEAYFKVEHVNDKPFIVDAGGVFIKDIGTSFNIKAYPTENAVEVYVESGEVEFYTAANTGLTLKQGESAIYNKTDNSFNIVRQDSDSLLAYKTRIFKFNNASLREVIAQLNSVYSSQIRLLNPNLGSCAITVSFEDEEIENIVQVISETLGLQVVVDDQGFALKGNSCSHE